MQQGVGKSVDFGIRLSWIRVSALSLTRYVTSSSCFLKWYDYITTLKGSYDG